MGIFWELMQEDELKKQDAKAQDLEARIEQLEHDLSQTRSLLRKTLAALEEHISRDIDGDGVTG